MRLFVAGFAIVFCTSMNDGSTNLRAQNGSASNRQSSQQGSQQGSPENALDLLETAGRINGFFSPDSAPWHLRATYSMLNAGGKVTGTGTYEIFWAGMKKVKQSYASKEFSQTDYITEAGLLRSGEMDWPMIAEQRVTDNLFVHIPPREVLGKLDLALTERAIAGVTLRCVSLQAKGNPSKSSSPPTFCLDRATPALRYSSGLGSNVIEQQSGTIFNNFVMFRGHAVSRDMTVAYKDRPSLKIHVDVLEDLASSNDDLFTPPANAAHPLPKRRYVDQLRMEARITQKSAPAFGLPDTAATEVMGMLDVIVGKDGLVKSVRPIMGPLMYEQGEINAVKKQRYQPTLVDGVPVEVETEIGYVFTTHPR
jgi:hypothetical protein